MIKNVFYGTSVLFLSFLGIGGFLFTPQMVTAEEEVTEHENVIAPTQALMREIESRIDNLLHGILGNNMEYVAEQAGAIADKSYEINKTFFAFEPGEKEWVRRSGYDPQDQSDIKNLRDEFNFFQSGIVHLALQIRKEAQANDQEGAFKTFTKMIEETCFDCHQKYRNWKLEQAGSHGPGKW